MSRPHHNVFFYDRGPSARESRQEGERYQQQVEDNSTKALVNVLQHGGPTSPAAFCVASLPRSAGLPRTMPQRLASTDRGSPT